MGFFTQRKVKQLQKVMESRPGDAKTILNLADSLVKKGEIEQAIGALGQLAQSSEEKAVQVEAAIRLGRLAQAAEDWEDAQEYYTVVLEAPETYEAEALLGMASALVGRAGAAAHDMKGPLWSAAESYLLKAESHELTPQQKRKLFYERALLLEEQGEGSAAYESLISYEKEAEKERGWSDEERLELAVHILRLATKHDENAVEALGEKTLKMAYGDTDRGKVLLVLGRFLKRRDPKGAQERLETAARYLSADRKHKPELVEVSLELGSLYMLTKQFPQAVAEAEKGLQLKDITPVEQGTLLEMVIKAAERNQDRARSLEAARQYVSIAETPMAKAKANMALGRLLMLSKKSAEGVVFIAEAIELDALTGEAALKLKLTYGEALFRSKQTQEAVTVLRELQKVELPQKLALRRYELMGAALLAAGRVVEAVESYSRLAAELQDERSQEVARDRLKDIRVNLQSGKLTAILSASDKEKLEALFGESVGEASYFERLRVGLSKTHDGFVGKIEALVSGKSTIDDEMLDDMEDILVSADIGVKTTVAIMDHIRELVDRKKVTKPDELVGCLKDQIFSILTERDDFTLDIEKHNPFVLMVIGVNGVGKTTTIAKLARRYSQEGKKVILAAGDTFRAGAIEQLEVWTERIGCEIIKHKANGDPSAVVFDAIHAAKNREADLLIIDTAGRLHTKVNLMEEMKKMKRIADREYPGTPHETLLVVDGNTGQNAISQAKTFNEALPIDGIAITKLDGTPKGGIVVTITHELKIPVKFIGIGEKYDDLRDFDPRDFTEALFAAKSASNESSSKMESIEQD